MAYPTWSQNGRYIYFYSFSDQISFYRIQISTGKVERVVNVQDHRGMVSGVFGAWAGLTPDDSPLFLRDVGFQEVYALELKLP